jgi:hypothetical protein
MARGSGGGNDLSDTAVSICSGLSSQHPNNSETTLCKEFSIDLRVGAMRGLKLNGDPG